MKTLIDHQAIVKTIIDRIETEDCIEGVFLAGSLVDENKDRFSDVDLGIASGNSSRDFDAAYSLRQQIIAAVGHPVNSIERGWEHCRMIAVLYSKTQFPPIGLEVDTVFSELRYVSEQMPYATHEIIFDRSGRLKHELDKMGGKKPKNEAERELKQHLSRYPFYVHDAAKACERGDSALLQSMLDEMRKLVFFAAAVRRDKTVCGSKRGLKYLSAVERSTVESSYYGFNKETVQRITDLYLTTLKDLELRYEIKGEVEQFQKTLQEIL